MRYLVTVLFLSIVGIGQAQEQDSLWRTWTDERNNDTVRLHALSQFAWLGYLFSDPDSAFYYGQMMYEYAAQKGLRTEMAYALRGQGVVYKVRGENVKALDLFLRSMEISEEAGDLAGVAGSLNNIGILYFEQGDYNRSLAYHRRSLGMRMRAGDIKGYGASLNSIGKIHEKLGEPELAMEMYMRSLQSAERIGFDLGGAYALVNMGSIYLGRNEPYRALEFYERGLAMHRAVKDDLAEATARNLIGMAQLEIGNTHAALVECNTAKSIAMGLRNLDEQRIACECLHKAYRSLGDRDQALLALEAVKAITDSLREEDLTMKLMRMEFTMESRMDSITAAEEEIHMRLLNEAAVTREKNRKNIFLIIGIAVFILAVGLYGRLRYINKARREAEVLREQAEEGVRVKQQFLANMSHEIRTPMNAIMGMTDLLLRNEHGPEEERYLEAIKLSSDNLLVILNDILDLSRLDSGRVELERVPFDPSSVVRGVAAIMAHKAEEKGLALHVDVAHDMRHELIGDPARLHQVLMNLVGNSIKFTEQGSVTIRASTTDSGEQESHLHIDVIDTGIGIAAEKQEKVFAEFDQADAETNRKYGGTGLGLTISKRLVEVQKGSITVQSELGKGSTFTVRIPYASGSSATARVIGRSTKDLKDLRILLVEADAHTAIVAQDELLEVVPGAQVDIVKDGEEAIRIVQLEQYDVVLMDCDPEIGKTCEAIVAIRSMSEGSANVPILATRTRITDADHQRIKTSGGQGVLLKPLKRKQLIGALSEALSQ